MTLNQRIVLGAVVGVLLGAVAAYVGSAHPVSQTLLFIANMLSLLFVGLLKMVMVPLVFTSIVVGVAQLALAPDARNIWKTTLVFYAMTTLLATVLGLVVMQVFAPGVGLSSALFAEQMAGFKGEQLGLLAFMEQFVKGLFVNPIAAMSSGNIMAVVVFAIFVGIALMRAGSRYQTLQHTFDQAYQLMMDLVGMIMQLAPLGIAALLTKLVATQDAALFAKLAQFMVVVIGATLFHGLVVLPLLLKVLSGKSPLWFFKQARLPLTTAFATSSSAATLPLTLQTLRHDMGVPPAVANFVAPLGAQVNMDGTALYEAAAALFVAQLMGIDLSLGQQVIVVLMAMLASVGAPGMPSAGMVTMVMVLQSVGLPIEAIAILLPIDRVLDAFRTTVNVEGDMVASLVVTKRANMDHGV